MEIRNACTNDLDAVAALEAACFPAAEAGSRASFRARLEVFPDHFWLLWDGETLAAAVNGMVTIWPMRCFITPAFTTPTESGR